MMDNQYSETIGSFVRTGGYPLEANYIFNSEKELKDFYSDELNNTLLHKGLLKVVSLDDQQILYWVISVDGELQFKPLISGNSLEDLYNKITELKNDLNQEITNKGQAILEILGTSNKSDFQNELDNLLKISNAVIDLQHKVDKNTDAVKAISGADGDNIRNYLESLDYKNLTEMSNLLHKFFDTIDNETEGINTLLELREFLKGFDHTYNLYQHLQDLWSEIQGTPTPNTEFRTLRSIQDFIQELSSTTLHRDRNLQTELDQTQIGVGLNSDGLFSPDQETTYLKNATSVMNALKTLDGLINQAINNCNIVPKNTDSVNLDIVKEADKNTISANARVGGDIIINSNGIYHEVNTEYDNGILTVKVNGNIKQQHFLGISSIINAAHYDPDTESIIIDCKLQDSSVQTIIIPVDKLITEWDVDNSQPSKVVELTKQRITSGGADKLSADVRIDFSNKNNILKKSGNSLLVEGISENIQHNGNTLKVYLNNFEATVSDSITAVNNKVNAETTRAITKEDQIAQEIRDQKTEFSGKIDEINQKLENVPDFTEMTDELNALKAQVNSLEWHEG